MAAPDRKPLAPINTSLYATLVGSTNAPASIATSLEP
jgi:hypothetical protein